MTSREHRLRQRIDTLTDERDHARAKIARLERLVKRWRATTYETRRSRDMWKLRARRPRVR